MSNGNGQKPSSTAVLISTISAMTLFGILIVQMRYNGRLDWTMLLSHVKHVHQRLSPYDLAFAGVLLGQLYHFLSSRSSVILETELKIPFQWWKSFLSSCLPWINQESSRIIHQRRVSHTVLQWSRDRENSASTYRPTTREVQYLCNIYLHTPTTWVNLNTKENSCHFKVLTNSFVPVKYISRGDRFCNYKCGPHVIICLRWIPHLEVNYTKWLIKVLHSRGKLISNFSPRSPNYSRVCSRLFHVTQSRKYILFHALYCIQNSSW